MLLSCPECAYLDLHHNQCAHHHHCHQHPNHHPPVVPQSDAQAPHRVGGASCWPPLFISLVPFRFVLAPSGHPNNSSTSTHKGAEPSSAQAFSRFTLTDSPTHTHTHSPLSHTHPKHNHLRVHALTHSQTRSLTHSPYKSRIPSLTNSSHSHSHIMQAVARRTTANLRHMLLAGTCPIVPVPNPQLPGELGKKSMQAVHSASGRLTTTDSQPSEAGINAIDSSQKPTQDHPVGELLEGSILVLARRKEGH